MISEIKKLIARFWLLFFFLLLFLLIAVFHVSLEQIYQSVISLRVWQISVLIVIYFAISLCIIIGRKYLLSILDHSCTFKNLVLIHFVSMAAHYSTPAKIGFPITVYLLKKYENIPYPSGTALILIELSVNMGICGLFAVIGSLFYFREYMGNIFKMLLIVGFFGIFTFWLINFLVSFQKTSSRFKDGIKSISQAISAISFSRLLSYCLIIVSTQIVSAASLVVLCNFFSIEISIWQAVTASAAAFFLGAVSMIPLGLGVREASMILFLNRFGIDNVSGVSIITIQRLLSTGLSFLLGTIIGAYLGIKNVRLDDE